MRKIEEAPGVHFERLPVAAQRARQLLDALDPFPFRVLDLIVSLHGGSPFLFGSKAGPIPPESVPEPPLSTFNYVWGMLLESVTRDRRGWTGHSIFF